ncbi:hypothetical protein BJ912DRAFT_163174 [Pholiota molesta]|nr:hypothetical protein BJ912DRAFT_163174 [Pholiota molesta]
MRTSFIFSTIATLPVCDGLCFRVLRRAQQHVSQLHRLRVQRAQHVMQHRRRKDVRGGAPRLEDVAFFVGRSFVYDAFPRRVHPGLGVSATEGKEDSLVRE